MYFWSPIITSKQWQIDWINSNCKILCRASEEGTGFFRFIVWWDTHCLIEFVMYLKDHIGKKEGKKESKKEYADLICMHFWHFCMNNEVYWFLYFHCIRTHLWCRDNLDCMLAATLSDWALQVFPPGPPLGLQMKTTGKFVLLQPFDVLPLMFRHRRKPFTSSIPPQFCNWYRFSSETFIEFHSGCFLFEAHLIKDFFKQQCISCCERFLYFL